MHAVLELVDLVTTLRALTARLVTCDDLVVALDALAETTIESMPGPTACGISLIQASGVTTVARPEDMPQLLATVQHETGDGPGIAAIQSRETVVSQRLRQETRWTDWTGWARACQIDSICVTSIDIDDQTVGTLSLYATEPDRFPPDVELTAVLIAEHAGPLIGGVLERCRLVNHAEELTEALGSGALVNRAVGIVMAQRTCPAEEALGVLQRAATTLGLPIATVAERLVDTVTRRTGAPRQR